jgi:hypothetical protein
VGARLRRAVRSRRSLVLLVFGILFVLIGFSYLGQAAEITASPAAQLSYKAHLWLMPLDVWSWLFIGAGAAGVVGGLTMRHPLGFTALMVMATWWGLEFIGSWIVTGYDRAVIGALVWIALTAALLIIVGWPDPTEVRIVDLFDWIDRQ